MTLLEQVTKLENLQLAEARARRGKTRRTEIIKFDERKDQLLAELKQMLETGKFRTSSYSKFTIFEPKERIIYKLPYYPDRIVHHALINVIGEMWTDSLIADTYACIKGKGIHAAANKVKEFLKDEAGTKYCLKIDIRKYFPSVDKQIAKTIISKSLPDNSLLPILDNIVDSSDSGLPIGNYLSQYLSNLYLNGLDHYIKDVLKFKYYIRYADDMVFLSDSKRDLWCLFSKISVYLCDKLNLQIKSNYQVFPVSARGIDFVGYVFYHTHTRLRKSIKLKFVREAKRIKGKSPIKIKRKLASWYGWCLHCDSKHLLKCVTHNLQVSPKFLKKRITG